MQRFKNVLYVYESETDNRAAFRRALDLAESNQARLTMLAVADVPPDAYEIDGITPGNLNNILIEECGHKADKLISSTADRSTDSEDILRSGRANVAEAEVDAYVQATKNRHADALAALMETLCAEHQDAFEFVNPQHHLLRGVARTRISGFVRESGADILVMGTVARTGIPGFIIGNTAENILGKVDCSVIAIKPPGFVTPVVL